MLKVYTDGACRVSNPGQASCAFVVLTGEQDGIVVHKEGFYLGPELRTNNYAEYMGLLKFLAWAKSNNVKKALIHCDSKLVVEQVNGNWACNKEDLKVLAGVAAELMSEGEYTLVHIRGHHGIVGNEMADELCNEILDQEQGVK